MLAVAEDEGKSRGSVAPLAKPNSMPRRRSRRRTVSNMATVEPGYKRALSWLLSLKIPGHPSAAERKRDASENAARSQIDDAIALGDEANESAIAEFGLQREGQTVSEA